MNPERERRARDLFDVVSQLPHAQRASFLDRECGDKELLRREVEDLLNFSPTKVTIAMDPPPHSGPRYAPADRIGDYEIVRALGEGGFGIVYLATQHEPVTRDVAIKVMRSIRHDGNFIRDYDRERQTLAKMAHPGIAHFYDAGITEYDQPYFVMEYVPGIPITRFCDEHRLNIRQRLDLMADVCRAVQHAHSKQVVHRDLTPNNILVSMGEDGVPRPRIIDFGIALGVDEDSTRIMGTPSYMSPEQATPEQDVDTRSDIYTLGAVLYELLIGQPPLTQEMLRDAELQAVFKLVREAEIPSPSTRLSQTFDADMAKSRQLTQSALERMLRRDLDWIPRKAMEKNPDDRYSTASDLAEDIDNYLDGRPITAVGPRRAYRLRKTLLRHKVTCAAVLAVLLSLTGGVIATSIFAIDANTQRALAETSEADAKLQKERAVASTKEANEQTKQAEANAEEAEKERETACAVKEANQALQLMNSRIFLKLTEEGKISVEELSEILDVIINFEIDQGEIGHLYMTMGVAFKNLKADEKAKDCFAQAETSFDIAGVHAAALERMLLRQYRIFDDIEESDFTLSGYDAALGLLPEELRRPAFELMNSVKIAYNKLDPDEQRKVSEAVKSAVSGIKITDIFEARGARASHFLKTGGPLLPSEDKEDNYLTSPEFISEAKTLARESLLALLPHMDVENLSDDASRLALILLMGAQFHDLAIEFATRTDAINEETISRVINITNKELSEQGKYEAAADVYKQWLDASITAQGEQHSDTIWLGYWLGQSLEAQKKYDEAEAVYRQWLGAAVSVQSKRAYSTIRLGYKLASVLDAQKKYDEAEAVYRQWLPISIDALGDDHDTTSELSMWLADCLYRQAKYAEAETIAREGLEASRQARGNGDAQTIWLGYSLGRSLDKQKKYDEAEAVYRQWLPISIDALGDDHDTTSGLSMWLAGCLYRQAKYADAETTARERLEASRQARGNEDADTIWLGYWLGQSLDMQKKSDKAEAVYRQWLPISVDALGDDHDTTSGLSMWLTSCLYRQAKYADAETTARERLEASRQARGDENVYTIWLGYWLTRSLESQKKYVEAEAVYRQWLPISIDALGDDHDATSKLSVNLAGCLYRQAKYADAETTARERLEASRQARGDENVYTIWLGYSLALSLDKQKKYDEAEAVYLIWLEACARSQGKHSQQAQQITSSLIDLYENWGKPEKAEQYRVLLQDEQTSP